MVELSVDIVLAVVYDFIITSAYDFGLRHLSIDPFLCLLGGNVVAFNYALYAQWGGGGDADNEMDWGATDEVAVEEDCAFEPIEPGCFEIAGYGGVDDVVDGAGVPAVFENEAGKNLLLQLVVSVKFRSHELA